MSSSRIDLSWSAASDNVGVTGYEIERCQGAGCSSFAAVTTVSTLAWSDTGRSPATSYSYRVRARDAAGNQGPYSLVVSAVTQAAVDNPPSAPSGLSAGAVSSSRMDLSWSAATDDFGVSSYEVERCQGAGCSSFVAVTTVTTLAWSDTGRSPATSYSYRVRARDTAGQVGLVLGNSDGGDTAAVDNPPSAPTGLSASASGSSGVNLSWTAATDDIGVASYEVERCQGAGCSGFVQVATTASTSLADTGLQASTSYSYRVRARDTAAQAGAYSNVASATTGAAPPPPSGNLVAAYAFDEGSGTTVGDLSGNGNNGTVQRGVVDDGGEVRESDVVQWVELAGDIPDAGSLDLSAGVTSRPGSFRLRRRRGGATVVQKGGSSEPVACESTSEASARTAVGGSWCRRCSGRALCRWGVVTPRDDVRRRVRCGCT